MSFVAIITSVISASYYIRLVILLLTVVESEIRSETLINEKLSTLKNSFNNETILTNLHSFLISTITLSILLFIFKPTILINSTILLSLSLFNY